LGAPSLIISIINKIVEIKIAKINFLKKKKIIAVTTPQIIIGLKNIKEKIPIVVANPLPPRNLKNKGKLCPKIAKKPETRVIKLSRPNTWEAKNTANHPFKKSNINAVNPAVLETEEKTLAAPTFPVPTLLISIPLVIFAMRKLKGIEPNR